MKDKTTELTDSISTAYQKFFANFKEIDSVKVEDWKPLHLIAHLCKSYKDHYGVEYTFKFNDPAPSKSYEVYTIKKLANMLTSDPVVLKEYIDWVFKHKVVEKKKRLTSLAFFSHQDIVNDYKFKFLLTKSGQLKDQVISRNDKLPDNVIGCCSQNGWDITTYAELAFIKRMPEQEIFFSQLSDIGFDINILDKVA